MSLLKLQRYESKLEVIYLSSTNRCTYVIIAQVVEWREQTITLVHEKAIERIRKWRQDGQERRKFAASLWQK